MMQRMWVRFGVTFGLFSLLGPILLVSLGFLTLQNGVLLTFIRNELRAEGGLIEQMVAHYRREGGWDGVEELLGLYDSFLPSGPEDYIKFELYFADEGQSVVYGSQEARLVLGANDGSDERLPIDIDGRTRGYLSVVQIRRNAQDPSTTPIRPFLIGQVSSALVSLGVFGAFFGVLAGLVVSRALARPLGQLAETAQRLGKRDFSARAEVKGAIEMRAVAQAFNDMADALSQSEEQRRNLVADVAHELRTPLTVLQANLQALSDGVYPVTAEEIERLLHQTQLLTHLVGELRELSMAEARQLTLNRKPLDLVVVLGQIAISFQPAADQHHIAIQVDAPQSVWIEADDERLQQVMNNVMDNALRHTPSGGQIRLAVQAVDGKAVLTVSDTGSGIAPEHLPHVFDRFYRADRSRSRQTGGSGLGLAIVKAIVELHGGTITAHSPSVAGVGTTIRIVWPLLP
jgi:signal transduction histidine kinase